MEENSISTNEAQMMNESNPLASNLHVRLSMPDAIDIEIVEASRLKEYELWAGFASFMLNFLVGFVVAAATNSVPERAALLWTISGIFVALFVITLLLALKFRKKIGNAVQTVKMVPSPKQ